MAGVPVVTGITAGQCCSAYDTSQSNEEMMSKSYELNINILRIIFTFE